MTNSIPDCEELMITWMLHTELGIKTNLYKEFEALQDGKTNEEWIVILKDQSGGIPNKETNQ